MGEDAGRLPIPPLGESMEHDRILRSPARDVRREELRNPAVQELIERMSRTLENQGVGLAAPQVGKSLRIAVVEDTEEFIAKWPATWVARFERRPFEKKVLVNPRLTPIGNDQRTFYEACLSKPQEPKFGLVSRHLVVRVEAMNEHGLDIPSFEVRGWEARIYQHECDHLDGVLCIDKFEPGSEIATEEFEALKKQALDDEQ